MTEDSMHRTLDAALARNSGPSAEDVEALARVVAEHGSWDFWSGATRCECGDELSLEGTPVPAGISVGEWRHAQHVARLLAAHTAAAEARGAERGARAVVEAVEETFLGQLPSKALSYCAQEDVNAGLDALAERFGLDGDPR